MDQDRYQELLRKLRIANNDAQHVAGLRHAGDEVMENVASTLDKLCDIVGALLQECGPTKHAQAVNVIMPPTPRMSLDEIAKNPEPRD